MGEKKMREGKAGIFASKKVKIVLAGLAVLLVLTVAATRFSRADMPRETVNTAPIVETQYPGTGLIQNSDELIGTIEPKSSAYVYPQLSGEVLSVSVKAGDQVSAGQLICTIDNNGEASARSSVDSALINLEDAEASLERTKLLYENGGVSQEAYEQAQSAYRTAQVQYESAMNTYSDQVGYSQVTAPIGGTIESLDVKAHDNASAQNPICVIAGGKERIVTFYAAETAARTLKVGDYVKIDKNGEAYDAVVSEISSMADETIGLFKIKADIVKGDGLATNSSVKVTLVSEESGGGLTLPLSAVYYDGGDAYVYLYEDGLAKKAPVETGVSSEEQIEIVSGLTAADQVIVTWASSLRDGASVELKGAERASGGAIE